MAQAILSNVLRSMTGVSYRSGGIFPTPPAGTPKWKSLPNFDVVSGTATTVVLYTASAPDTLGATVTYGIQGGDDAARFVVDTTTGRVYFTSVPSYDSPSDSDGDNKYELILFADNGTTRSYQALTARVIQSAVTSPDLGVITLNATTISLTAVASLGADLQLLGLTGYVIDVNGVAGQVDLTQVTLNTSQIFLDSSTDLVPVSMNVTNVFLG